MNKLNQDGSIGAAAIGLILAVIFLVLALGFGGWAYLSRQDYKNNTDAKISTAVEVAKKEESSKKDKEFVEKEKNPLRTYAGPQAYGSLNILFPKTWSGNVNDSGTGSAVVDGFFYPNIVPATQLPSSSFALRVQVSSQTYAQVLQTLQALQQSKQTTTTVVPYALPKMPTIIGVKVTGTLLDQKTGEMVILPLRTETLLLWTEGDTFKADFNNIILPNFTFVP